MLQRILEWLAELDARLDDLEGDCTGENIPYCGEDMPHATGYAN